MARGKKRTYKRNYNNGYKRYRQVASRNYFKVKAEFYDFIQYPDENGKPIFYSKRGADVMGNRAVLTVDDMLSSYTYTNILQGLFSYYKVLGLAVEVIPKYNNGDVVTEQRQTFIGFRAASNEAMTMSELKAINQSFLLDPRNRQRRYWRVFNTGGDWQGTGQVISGGITVQSPEVGNKNTQHIWDIKVSIYLLYKYSKA